MEIIYYIPLFFISFLVISKHLLEYKKKHHHKNQPPTPLTLPIIGHLHLLKKPLYRTLAGLSDRYGPILSLRFGSRPVLVVSSPSAVEECLTKNDLTFANRPRLLAGKHLGYNYTSLVWASYGSHWRNLRRITTLEIFSTNRLLASSNVRVDEIKLLMRQLYRSSDDQGGFVKVELKSKFFELMLNVMMRMIAGKRYYGEEGRNFQEARRFQEIVEETFYLSGVANLEDFWPGLRWLKFLGLQKRLVRLHRKRDEFMQGLIDEHRRSLKDGENEKKTMIDVLLHLQESEPQYYTDQIIKGIISNMLTAGTDTSAATMEWVMSLLVNHPEELKKALTEFDTYMEQGHFLEELDLGKLPYLHCIINETLRLYPAGPLLVPHESSEEVTVGGFDVPCGTMLLVNIWAIQRDPKIWEEPMRFKPERFKGVEGEREGFKFMPFGSGRRSCPGTGLAMRVVGLTVGSLIQCFEWKRVGEEKVDMREGLGLTMPKAEPLEVMYRPRRAMTNVLSQL